MDGQQHTASPLGPAHWRRLQEQQQAGCLLSFIAHSDHTHLAGHTWQVQVLESGSRMGPSACMTNRVPSCLPSLTGIQPRCNMVGFGLHLTVRGCPALPCIVRGWGWNPPLIAFMRWTPPASTSSDHLQHLVLANLHELSMDQPTGHHLGQIHSCLQREQLAVRPHGETGGVSTEWLYQNLTGSSRCRGCGTHRRHLD